ncbi:hypothetical protein [Acidicapsa acidisoli]|uniref:hypothetical protein n=1 Tax=Acidicapsa acidisoli TaxID=1615681 RepID=UPI0021DF68FC|nr:hypothetical protein [Acidicapsa acidisoli]
MLGESEASEYTLLTESQKDAIREQLNRLLANPYFSHSKRFPAFLRFVTEHTLAGDAENIKERTLGVEIFGRDANYDTASDPIVRVTAAEIRKRVAQYYQDPAHTTELRITLPSGSYIPQFHWPKGTNDPVLKELDLAAVETLTGGEATPEAKPVIAHRHSLLVLALTCVVAGLLSVGGVLFWQAMHRSALDYFWQPVLTTNDPVLLCIADQLQYSSIVLRQAADPTQRVSLNDKLTAIVMDDVFATVKVAGVLQSRGRPYSLKSEGATELEDLRNGPTVFIGAFDNAWTLRLTNTLRYHFANDQDMTKLSIVDSNAPSQTRWVVDRSVQMATNNYRDYAIVARFTDTNTGKLAVVVAGIGRGGTIAAGEFLTDAGDLARLQRAAQEAGNKKNMEVVLSTQIIDGEPGSPKMEAAHFW